MCKECEGRKEYKSFDELPQELKELYKGRETKKGRDAYVDFINKLNIKGDELVSDYVNAATKVRIHYGKCSHEHPEGEGVTPNDYKNGYGCGVCCGRIVVEGVNDLATNRPEIAIEWHPTKIGDLKPTRVTCKSNKKVWWLCLDCGYEWEATIATRTSYDTSCSRCGDGISRPNKVMALVVEALGLNYELEYVVEGYSQYRFDIYLPDYKQAMENDGGQHYAYLDDKLKDKKIWNNKTGMEIHYIDLGKESVLMNEGLGLIVVDCRESNIDYIRNSVENHPFFQQFDLSNINWEEIDIQTQKSKKIEVCRYWKEQKEVNKDLTPSIVAEIFNIDKTTIVRWLTWGNESGLCTYSGEDERKTNTRRQSKFVYLVKPDGTKWYDEAMSQSELARLTGIDRHTIGYCRINSKSLEGKNAQYDSKYIGSYVVEEDKLEEFLLNLKGGDIIE